MKHLVLTLIFLVAFIEIACGRTVRIHDDNGGDVKHYVSRYLAYAATHTRVVIDGDCVSACVRFMSLKHVCATPRGRFFMHGITTGNMDDVDVAASIRDSERWELPASIALQHKYGAFSFGAEPYHIGPDVVPVEPGVAVVYKGPFGSRHLFQKFLRVDAQILIPSCKAKLK